MGQRVFITGASGYLGSAIAARIRAAGHEVTGLTRSPEHAAALEAAGIPPVLGSLDAPETYLGALKNSDVAVHVAYDDDAPAARDQTALEAFRQAAQDGRLRRLLYTSAPWNAGDAGDSPMDEGTPLDPPESARWRAAHEEVALDLADDEVAVVVFRPAIVYGESRGIFGEWFAEARARHTVTLPGDGRQHWALVHRDDVAEAYRLGLEYAHGGERFLVADGAPPTVREIGEAIARVTGATLRFESAAELAARGGPRTPHGVWSAARLENQEASAARARRELGWVPRHASFVSEVETLYREWQEQPIA